MHIRRRARNFVKRLKQSRGKTLLVFLGTALGIVLILFSLHVTRLSTIVRQEFEGKRWSLPSKIYSDSFILYPGQDVIGIHLHDRLARLGYHSVSRPVQGPGEYQISLDFIDLYLHHFSFPDHEVEAHTVRILLSNGSIRKMIDPAGGNDYPLLELEPELIAAFFNEAWEERDLIQLDDLAPSLIQAILAVEDRRFFQHFGLDPRAIARALWVNLRHGMIKEGGSTITQQLVKNFYLDHRRTVRRKLNEAVMALILEWYYPKEEILEAYLNEVYFGQSGTMGIYGVGEAARFYFQKKTEDLTLAQSALLAGVINSPNLFSPFNNHDKASRRQTLVLDRMKRLEMITDHEYRQALQEGFNAPPPVRRRREAPYFVDFVRQQLVDHYSTDVLNSEGLRIFTTLDTQLQHQAASALKKGLQGLESRHPALKQQDPMNQIQGALISLQPQTGHVKAMVGGRDYSISQFNRASQARRQPGSLFKLFVYAAALTQERHSNKSAYTAASLIEDSPLTLDSAEGTWSPENYDKIYHGMVTLRTALEKSLNAATVRLGQDVGLDRIIELAHAAGIQSPLKPVPSLPLGTFEVIPLEMAVAYGTIANGGVKVDPLAIKEVVTADGLVLERRTFEMTQVMSPEQAYVLSHLLEGVVNRGTARDVRRLGVTGPVAGKTGTSSFYRDAWFAGYTPELLAVVWVGFDQTNRGESSDSPDSVKNVPLTGATAALPIWADFIRQASEGSTGSDFIVPKGVEFQTIDQKTGLVSNIRCPDGIEEAFITGTIPTGRCRPPNGLAKGILRWFKGLFSEN